MPPANSAEAKKLVEEAPYHPGYEGAVISTLETVTIPPLNREDVIKLDGWGAQPTINLNTDPKPQNIPFDWNKITFTSSGMIAGSGTAGGGFAAFSHGSHDGSDQVDGLAPDVPQHNNPECPGDLDYPWTHYTHETCPTAVDHSGQEYVSLQSRRFGNT